MSPTAAPSSSPGARADTATDGHLALFNTEAYHRLTLRPGEAYLRVDVLDDAGALLGSLCGVRDGSSFDSGRRAPYGGVDLVRPGAPVAVVERVLAGALEQLAADGVRDVRLAARPAHHAVSEPVVHALAHRLGFALEHVDLNQHLDLAGLGDAAGYLASLPAKRARALRRDLDGSLVLEDVAPQDLGGLAEAHAVLRANRLAHGRPPGLELEYLERLRAAFGPRIRCHVLRHEGRAVAAALVYRVADGRDLVAWWGDAPHDLPRSPMKVLAHHVVGAALAAGAQTLDLGPSTEKDGTPNHGLLQFKREVGAREEPRPVLRWRA